MVDDANDDGLGASLATLLTAGIKNPCVGLPDRRAARKILRGLIMVECYIVN